MSDKMVLLAIYGNPIEAELARAELEAEGIRAYVMGATSGDLFAGMGVGMSNVQVLVPERDYERATQLLAEESDVAREARENREREEEEYARRRSTAIKEAEAAETDSTDIRPAAESPVRSGPPPAAPPESVEEGDDFGAVDLSPDAEAGAEEREKRPLLWTADDIASRAFRAALFSYILCPMIFGLYLLLLMRGLVLASPVIGAAVLLYAYSAWLMIRLPLAEGELSASGARRAYAALALILLPFLLGIVLVWFAAD